MYQIVGIFLLGFLIGTIIGEEVCHGMSRKARRLHDKNARRRRLDDTVLYELRSRTHSELAKKGYWHRAFKTNS